MTETQRLLLKLIRGASTIRQVQLVLKEVGALSSAANWDELIEKRVTAALNDGTLADSRLLRLLADQEEYGRQHIFLFSRANKSLPTDAEVETWAASVGAKGAFKAPRVLDLPAHRTITEIRREIDVKPALLAIKTVETRTTEVRQGAEQTSTGRIVQYVNEDYRAVNVVCLRSNGLLEVRIASHRRGGDYVKDVNDMLALVEGLVPAAQRLPVPLTKAKRHLWDYHTELSPRIRFSNQRLRDDAGNSFTAATGTMQAELFAIPRVEKALEAIVGNDEATFEAHNIWWKKQLASGIPEDDIHVLLDGESNEFAVTQQCSRATYEHILRDILGFNS